MALASYDILVPGNYFCDLIFTGFPEFPALGTEVYVEGLTVVPGGALNTVIALQRLGVRVGWMGTVGTDFFSRFVLETAEAEGVDTALLERRAEPFQRVTAAISYPHDRAFITYIDPSPGTVSRVLAALEDGLSFKHLHFTGLIVHPDIPDLIQRCHARGITVSMDCQHRPNTLQEPLTHEIVRSLDVFMPNRGEALRLTGRDTLNEAASVLREMVPLLVIKDGAAGSMAWRGDTMEHLPALTLDAVDTTGAGDVFNAGFLAAHLNGEDLKTCLTWGTICGGLSTLGYGGVSTAPTLDALHAHLMR
ncbi:MAG: carbohydrate kinase family protein [Anaerolineae bacterium]